ncbi:hypothetical protein ABZ858_00545 [Streptomyces sp. NPDC047017]|uniref:hypothetical protein n=1 Tax=Streptomyces sp. NPDC047017 TaxID=3155024 RepID=UPI0033E23C6B
MYEDVYDDACRYGKAQAQPFVRTALFCRDESEYLAGTGSGSSAGRSGRAGRPPGTRPARRTRRR